MSGEPTFFEIGVADEVRARAFYGGLFGWRIEPGPSAAGYYGAYVLDPDGNNIEAVHHSVPSGNDRDLD